MVISDLMNEEKPIQLLVIAYPQDWHWALSVEYFIDQVSRNEFFHVLDLSFVGQSDLRSFLRWVMGGNRLRKTGLSIIKACPQAKVLKRKALLRISRAFFASFLDIRKLNPVLTFENSSTIYNTCVEKTGNLHPVTRKNSKLVFKELLSRNSTLRALETLDLSCYDRVVTVNGRFTKNAVVKSWASENLVKCRLLEFGSNRDSFQIYEVSPHSMSELEEKINEFWDGAEEVYRKRIAFRYLTELSTDKPITDIDWRFRMQKNLVPAKRMLKSCVFFTSTEAEYAGVGDLIPMSRYQNQVEAFRAVVEGLPADEWEIFLRRHPANPKTKVRDAEYLLWEEFEGYSNVTVIAPESSIDSIALGMGADLAFNYCSIIAMELVARGAQHVFTMGPSPWQGLLPERQLQSDFSLMQIQEKRKLRVETDQILPWCFYSSKHGFDFQITKYFDSDNNWRHISNGFTAAIR
jgi:hypothetical protein